MTKIAFIGLGAMGAGMSRNLLQRGFDVHGYDVVENRVADFRAAGGTAAGSAAEACVDAGFIVLMVVNAAQAHAVLFEEEALKRSAPNATVCLMATCSPAAAQAIAAKVTATGRSFLEAPVSGGTAGAKSGQLTVMAAGPVSVFEQARPIFDAMASRVFHLGEQPGQGAIVKLINQVLCGVHVAVAAEALALAEKVGVDSARVLEILQGTAASSWMLNDRGPRMLQEAPEVSSAVDILVKDLGIVLEAGRETKAALPLAAVAHQLFLSASARGYGTADDSQLIRIYRSLNGG